MIAPVWPPWGGAGRLVTEVFEFDGWALWPGTRQLLHRGRPVALGGRAFNLLLVLLEQPERLVPQDELLERVWPGLAVEPNNLQVQVWALRRLLGPAAIVNVPRRGYRLTLPVRAGDPAATAGGDAASRPVTAAAAGDAPDTPAAASAIRNRSAAWLAWAAPLQLPGLVTLIGAEPARLRQAAEDLAAQRRVGSACALWRIALPPADSAAPQPAWPDAADPLWRRLAGAPGQLLLLDCQHAPPLARQLARAARRAAPALQVLATAQRPLDLAGEVVADLADVAALDGLGGEGNSGDPAGPALRWQARRGPSGR